MRRKYLLIICLFCLTGCWDRAEINDLAFVTATGVDKVEENKFSVAVEVPLPGAMGGTGSTGGGGGTEGGPYYVDSETARSIRESDAILQQRMSRKLYFGHRRVIIFGDKLARTGFQKSLNVIVEQPQSRLSSFVLITNGKALDILNSTPHMEKINAEAMREMAKSFMDLTVKEVLNDIKRPGKDPLIPVIEVVKTKNGESKDKKDEVMIMGVGIFKGENLVYYANREETYGALWLLEKMKDKSYTFPVDEKGEINVNITHVKIDTNVTAKEEHPAFDLEINVSAIVNQNENQIDLSEEKKYQQTIELMEKEIKHQVESVLAHSKEERIDVFGLGWYLFLHENLNWEKKWSKRWDELLPEIKVNIKVNADITQSINPGIHIRE